MSRLIAAGFPSEWLDSTYAENRERIQARARRRFPRLFIDREKEKSLRRRRVTIGTALFIGFIGFAGLINSFLDKGFGFNRTTLWLYLGECIGVGIVTLTSQLPILFGGLRERRMIHMHVLVGGMIIAIICVSASRAIGLSRRVTATDSSRYSCCARTPTRRIGVGSTPSPRSASSS